MITCAYCGLQLPVAPSMIESRLMQSVAVEGNKCMETLYFCPPVARYIEVPRNRHQNMARLYQIMRQSRGHCYNRWRESLDDDEF
jgi:polyferredoxin